MFCPSCRRNIPDGSRVCFACGKHIPAHPVAPSKNSRAWLGLLIAALVMLMAWAFVYYQGSPRTTKFASTASYSELRDNIGRAAYNVSNGLKIGTVTAVIPKVVGDKTVYFYKINSDGRVLQFAPETVRLE